MNKNINGNNANSFKWTTYLIKLDISTLNYINIQQTSLNYINNQK